MVEIRSGKELCGEFFGGLVNVNDVDMEICNMLQKLYEEKRLTTDSVLSALKNLREGGEDE